ncbi:MAG TPA: BTAD domain-containing putative transcriptional regulator, partial [Acidimicrobiales bacterium]|nr:BTAD domain-containing putative transcriptional regulator [Acidimicrobiales bacterium]
MSGGRVHFGLLGPLEATCDGEHLDLGRPKQRVVLAALLVNANRVVSLDRFAEFLWPEAPAGRSMGSLPVYIANLRRLLEPGRPARTPPERILTHPPGYLLRTAPGEYDAADFEELAAQGNRHLADGRPRAARRDLGQALSLWRGRALAEFDFAAVEAERLESLRVAALEARIEADLALGAHTSVVDELQALVQEHPLRERLVGLLMVALYRSGRQVEALRAYAAARTYLAEELGLDPGPDLRRLESCILAQEPQLDWTPPPEEAPPAAIIAPARPDTAEPPEDVFVGRADQLAAIEVALARSEAQSGGFVLVAGEPGIGKTRLVHEAVTAAAARGRVVAWGRCEEGDGAPPFWPWVQVIRSLLEHPDTAAVRAALGAHGAQLAQLVPEVASVVGELAPPPPLDPAGARYRFFEAVGGFLENLARSGALALVIDDLQWADPPSLELTVYVARRIPALNALLVATYRDVDPAPDGRLTETLAALGRLPGRLHVRLGGLNRDEVAQFMAHEAGGEAPAGVVDVVWARAAGNPFFVGELTRLLVAEKRLTADAAGAAVPWAVRQVVERRLARLPEETRRLLTVAAVAGLDFDLRVVAMAAGMDLDPALDLTDLAVAAGVVAEQPAAPERFVFSHALVQETVYAEASRLRRARLHGQVAEALERVGGDQAAATEVARHLYEAVPITGPERAVAAALRASAAAQAALAYEVAEGHLQRALELVATMAPGRDRDLHELNVQDQLAPLLTLVKGVAVAETAAAWTRATELCQSLGDQRRLLQPLWGLLSFAWASGDLAGARALGEHLLRLGLDASEPVVTAAAHLGLGSVALCAGDLAEGARHLTAGKELADSLPDDTLAHVTHADLRVQVDSWLAMAHHLRGRHADGQAVIDGALARSRSLGDPFSVAIGLAFAVFARVLSGAVADAGRFAEELLVHSGTHQLADFAFHAKVAQLWTAAHRPDAETQLRATLDALPPAALASIRPWRPFWLALAAEAWQRLGRVDRAERAVEEAL